MSITFGTKLNLLWHVKGRRRESLALFHPADGALFIFGKKPSLSSYLAEALFIRKLAISTLFLSAPDVCLRVAQHRTYACRLHDDIS